MRQYAANLIIWIIISSLLTFVVTSAIYHHAPKNDSKAAVKAKSDSLLLINYQLQQAKKSLQMSDSIITDQRAQVEQQDRRYQANRQGDERLKVKQKEVRKRVENLNDTALINAIETF